MTGQIFEEDGKVFTLQSGEEKVQEKLTVGTVILIFGLLFQTRNFLSNPRCCYSIYLSSRNLFHCSFLSNFPFEE